MQEKIDMRGQVLIRMSDREGRVVEERVFKNRIVHGGRMMVARMFGGIDSGAPPTQVTHMAVGSGAPDASGHVAPVGDEDAALAAQRGARKPITTRTYRDALEDDPGTPGVKVKRVHVSLTTVFDFDEANDPNVPLREAGVFTAATGGTMYNRVVFEPVTKTPTFKLTLLWDIVF